MSTITGAHGYLILLGKRIVSVITFPPVDVSEMGNVSVVAVSLPLVGLVGKIIIKTITSSPVGVRGEVIIVLVSVASLRLAGGQVWTSGRLH